jgi:DNA-binding protein HU-beta
VNKAELIAHVAKDSDLSKDAAEKAVDAMFRNIERALRGGDTVRIVGAIPGRAAQGFDRPHSADRRRGAHSSVPRAEIPRR